MSQPLSLASRSAKVISGVPSSNTNAAILEKSSLSSDVIAAPFSSRTWRDAKTQGSGGWRGILLQVVACLIECYADFTHSISWEVYVRTHCKRTGKPQNHR